MAFQLNSTPTDGNWGFPSIPDKYNVFSKREINPKNAIVVKVFVNGKETLDQQSQIDRSKGICEQLSKLTYFEDWETVEVVRGAPHADRVGIDLRLIPGIQASGLYTSELITKLMRAFKHQFNDDCHVLIAELQRGDSEVWLEVTKIKEQITEQEANQTFNTIDANHDKAISQAEYFKALRPTFVPQVAQKLGLGVVSGQECEERTVAQKRFDNIDQNQDKRLSWDEFRTFYARKPRLSENLWNGVVKEKKAR
jgi:Ca2+-binding EF-hand superfamily protein